MSLEWLKPSEIAAQRRVKVDVVLGWIRRGELRAINVALEPTGRPRWRIDPDALGAFDALRVNRVPERTRMRRKRAAIPVFV